MIQAKPLCLVARLVAHVARRFFSVRTNHAATHNTRQKHRTRSRMLVPISLAIRITHSVLVCVSGDLLS